MKSLLKFIGLAAAIATPLFAQTVDPCKETTKLSTTASGVQTYTSNSNGNKSLGGSGDLAYGYEMWTAGGNNNKLIWFGPNQGGGMAFKTEYNNPDDYLGRIGFYWGKSGKKWDQYQNIYADFNYTRSANGTGGNYSYIGIYGWTWSPMMEWYIIDDWYGSGQLGPATICGNSCTSLGTLTVDGGTYNIYTNTRPQGSGSIDGTGNPAFPQIFSIRQGMSSERRQCGTYSITEHFKAWDKITSLKSKIGSNTYEAKFLAEAGGGSGWLELSYLKMTQEATPRSSSSGGNATTSSSSRASSSSGSNPPVSCNYQTSFCGGMSFANVSDATSIPSTGDCVYIGDFEVIQPNLNSTIAINGVENTCGADWEDCPYNDKPSAIDGGYYVYVKTGAVNSYENNGWQDVIAKTKPNCTSFGAQSSSSAAVSSSSVAVSSSSNTSSSSAAASSSSSATVSSSSSATVSSSSNKSSSSVAAATSSSSNKSSSSVATSDDSSSSAVTKSSSSSEEWNGTDSSSSSDEGNTPIKMLSPIPSAAFRVQAMSNGTLLVESHAKAAVYLFDTKGNIAQKIQVPAGSSIVKTSVPVGIYVVKNAANRQTQMVVVK